MPIVQVDSSHCICSSKSELLIFLDVIIQIFELKTMLNIIIIVIFIGKMFIGITSKYLRPVKRQK